MIGEIEGWMVTSGFVVISAFGTFVAMRVGFSKDIKGNGDRIDSLGERLKNTDEGLVKMVDKEDCKERRDEFKAVFDDIKTQMTRIENIIIENGRR